MSNYQEEAGRYILPAGEMTRFVKEAKVFYAKFMADCYTYSVKSVELANKHKLNLADDYSWPDAVTREFNRIPEWFRDELYCLVGIRIKKTASGQYAKPLKKDFSAPLVKTLKDSFKLQAGYEGLITAMPASNSISWRVDNNNRSVEGARSSPAGRFLFDFLRTVKWRGKTGGKIAYSDEYMRDDGPCEPNYLDVYGYEQKVEEKRFEALARRIRKRR